MDAPPRWWLGARQRALADLRKSRGGSAGSAGGSPATTFWNQQRASGSSLNGLEARRTPDLRAQWFEVGVLMRGAPGGRLRGRGGARTPGN